MAKKTPDNIDWPDHYNKGNIQPIDFIEDQQLGYHLGNIIKYVCRAAHKGQLLEDLKKARWYLNKYIKLKEKEARTKKRKKRKVKK